MVELLRRLGRFLTSMDARAITSLGVSVCLLLSVLLMFFFGQQWLNLEEDGALRELVAGLSGSRWAVLGVIALFMLLALTGFPQVALITATVIVFGSRDGAIYSWIATMASATLTFGLGHYLGGGWVRRFGAERVQRTIDFLARRGIIASGLVRVVPSAPFIVVNAAAGAAHIPLWKFWTGTGVGIVPKIALIAGLSAFFPGKDALRGEMDSLREFFLTRDPLHYALIGLVIAGWLIFLLVMRRIYRRLRKRENVY